MLAPKHDLATPNARCHRCNYDRTGIPTTSLCPECSAHYSASRRPSELARTSLSLGVCVALCSTAVVAAFVDKHFNLSFILFVSFFTLIGCFGPTMFLMWNRRCWHTLSAVCLAVAHGVAIPLSTYVFSRTLNEPGDLLVLPLIQTTASSFACLLGAGAAKLLHR